MQPGEKISCGLFVASGDGSKVLDCIEEAFDEVALAVEREVTIAFDLSI